MDKKHLTYFVAALFMLLIPIQIAFGQSNEAIQARNAALEKQKQGDIQGAIAEAKKAITLDSGYATPHNDLGVLYEETGQLDLAIQEYKKALNIDPTYTGVYTNLAALYENQGDREAALGYWRKRAQMGPQNDPWRQKALERIRYLENPSQDYIAPSASFVGNQGTHWKAAEEPSKDKKIKKFVSEAKQSMRQAHFDVALEKVAEAEALGAESRETAELRDKIRSEQIKYDMARASAQGELYKETKLLEVEDAWYPPKPEADVGKPQSSREDAFSVKSAARHLLEKKAKQVIPSIDFSDARLKDVVEYLALSNDINIVIDEQVVDDGAGVTIHLKNIPLVEALDIILRTKGLKYRFEENIIWITTADKLAQEDLTVRVYDVQDLVGKLHDFPSKPFDIESILEANDGGSQPE